MSPDGRADGKKQGHERYARLILRRNVQVAVQQKIRLSLKLARPKVHQEKGEVIQHIGRRKRRTELEAIEQDRLIVDHRDVREMQVAMCVPAASLSGTGIQQFGMAMVLFPLSLTQPTCGRSRHYRAQPPHTPP